MFAEVIELVGIVKVSMTEPEARALLGELDQLELAGKGSSFKLRSALLRALLGKKETR